MFETTIDFDSFPPPEPCAVGPEGHTWTLVIEEGTVQLNSGCYDCDSEVLSSIGSEIIEMPTRVTGKLKFVPEHENLGGRHGLNPCDCGWWWEFVPDTILEEEAS